MDFLPDRLPLITSGRIKANLTMVLCSWCNLVSLFLVFVIVGMVSLSWADEVYFMNGDRMSGTIVRMEDETLILQTTFIGEMRIKWENVKGLSSETPVTIELHDGSQYKGPLVFTQAEGFRMLEPKEVIVVEPPETQSKKFSLDSIAAINPLPWFRYKGDTSLGGNRTAGNSDTQAVNGSTTGIVRFGGHRVSLGGKFNYGESRDQVTARNSRGSLKYDYFLSQKIFLTVDELFEQDSFQDLTVRSSTSVGIGYQIFDTKEHELAVIIGPGFVHQDFQTRPSIQSPTTWWSINWEYWIIPKTMKIFLDHQSFKDVGANSSALRVNSNQGVRIWLNEHLYLNLEYDIRFNSQPLSGNKKFDEAFIFGIGFGIGNF